jgi:hypothetical protein
MQLGRFPGNTYAIEILGVDMALGHSPAELFLNVRIVTGKTVSPISRGNVRNNDSLQLIVAIDAVPVIIISAFAGDIAKVLDLSTRDASPVPRVSKLDGKQGKGG